MLLSFTTLNLCRQYNYKRRLQFERQIDITFEDVINARKKLGYKTKSKDILDHMVHSHGTGKVSYTMEDVSKISKAVDVNNHIILIYCIFIYLFSVYTYYNFIWHFPLLLLFGLFAPGLFVCAVLAAVFVSVFCLTDRQTFLHDRVCDLHRSVILRSVNHFGYRSRFKERVCFFLFQEFYCFYCIHISIFTLFFITRYYFMSHQAPKVKLLGYALSLFCRALPDIFRQRRCVCA